MATLKYWTGAGWGPISGGTAVGVPGPAGADGQSVNVFGPQASQPIPSRKGDMWLAAVTVKSAPAPVATLVDPPSPSPYPTLSE
jgi:hypothetical protein